MAVPIGVRNGHARASTSPAQLRGGWWLAAPYLFFAGTLFLVPIVWSLVLVLLDTSLVSPTSEFVGIANLVDAVRDPQVQRAFGLSYLFLVLFVPATVAVAVMLAVLINSLPRLKGLFAVGYFLPFVASTVAIAAMVQTILGYSSPLNNWLRRAFGSSPDWFGDPVLAILVIVLMIMWKSVGYYMLIVLAGLQSIPPSLHEAAQIDGAGPVRRLFKITIPMLYPALYTVMILAVAVTFSIFIEPYLLTNGGPQGATMTWQLLVYNEVFSQFRAGYGASIALLQAVATMVTVLVIRRIMEAWGRKNGF